MFASRLTGLLMSLALSAALSAGLPQRAKAEVIVDHNPVHVGDYYHVTATTPIDVRAWGNRYEIDIHASNYSWPIQRCAQVSNCDVGSYADWYKPDDFHPASPITYSAELLDHWYGGSTDLGTVVVSILPHRFHVDLGFSARDGGGYDATATTDGLISAADGTLRFESLNGWLPGCWRAQTCSTSVDENNAYRAVAQGGDGKIYGSSDWYVIAPGQAPKDIGAADTDLAALVALFPSLSDLCDSFLAAGTHILGGTVSDQYLTCEAGHTMVGAVVALLAGGTLAALVYAATHHGTAGSGPTPSPTPTPTTTPTPTPPSGGGSTTGPAPPPSGVINTDALAAQLSEQNWDQLKQRYADEQTIAAVVTEAARQCEAYTIDAGVPTSECGSLPIYLVGRLWPEARDHIIRGLAYYPPWVRLQYKSVERTPWYYGYPETDGGAPSCRGSGFITACDEFPWQATEQGGEIAMPLPHLKIIDYTDNSGSGGDYGHFVDACKLNARKGDASYGDGRFLVVPLPALLPDTTPSAFLCNGDNPPA